MRQRKPAGWIGKSVLMIAALWMAVGGQASAQSTLTVNIDVVDAGAHPTLRALVSVTSEANRQSTPIFPIGQSTSRLDTQYLQRVAVRTGGQFQSAPAPVAPAATPVPAASPTVAPAPVSQRGSLVQWFKDNLALMIAIAAAGLLLLLMIITAIVLALRVRRRSVQESAHELPAYPQPPFGGTTLPGAAPRTASAPTVAGQSASPGPGIRTASPSTAHGPASREARPSPFQPSTPSPPTAPVSPASTPFQPSPRSGEAEKPVMPPMSGDTVIIQHDPKLKVLGTLVDKKASWRRFDIDKPTVTIGRAPGNNFVVEYATVSRKHAVIKIEGEHLRLYDLGSANGSFVNDKRVREPVVLQEGDTVRLGEAEFIFKQVRRG